jgi:glycosyltransferase involved in cell wall biosynthesis
MKILYINNFYDPYIGGGAEITLKNLVEGLKERNHNILVVSLWEKKEIEKESINGIKVIRLPIKNIYLPFKSKQNKFSRNIWHLIESYNPLVINNLKNVINEFNPDIVSIHNTQGWSAPVLWKFLKFKNIPFIQVLHDQYLLCPTNMFKNGKICKKQCNICKALRIMYKKNSNYVKNVVGISNFILNKYKKLGYFKKVEFYEVIYNSRNVQNFKYNLNHRKNIFNDIVFGFIGTLVKHKGIEVLLDVFTKSTKNNWKLVIAGNGEKKYVEYLKQKYKNDNIKYLGRVHPDEFYPYVDCVIIPSLWEEALGMTVIESFIYGKPVIGSKIGGIPEMINESNGYIFSYNDKLDLYNKMIDFEKNIQYWKKNSFKIQNDAIQKYNYENWLNKWENFYENISN